MVFLHSHQHLSIFHHSTQLHFLPSNLHLNWNGICFVNVFGSFIPVYMFNMFRFESFVLYGTHTLLDRYSEYYNSQHIYLI